MNRSAFSKSQLFLMEFILVILFFAICASICVLAFVKSDRVSRESSELNQGMVLAQSVIECLKAAPVTEIEKSLGLMGLKLESTTELSTPLSVNNDRKEVSQLEERYLGFYDSAFQPCKEEFEVYQAEARVTYGFSDEMVEVTVSIIKQDHTKKNERVKAVGDEVDLEGEVCNLSAVKYVPGLLHVIKPVNLGNGG